MSTLKEGDRAPDFTLPTDTGDTVSLSALLGRKIVVYFYPKDDTSGCTKEAIGFSELKPDFVKADSEIIGISADSVAKHEKFKAKHDLDIILASDEKRAAIEAYGVWILKSMYGRSYMGIHRSTFLIGRDGRIAHIWRKVKVANHAAEVLKAAQNLD